MCRKSHFSNFGDFKENLRKNKNKNENPDWNLKSNYRGPGKTEIQSPRTYEKQVMRNSLYVLETQNLGLIVKTKNHRE